MERTFAQNEIDTVAGEILTALSPESSRATVVTLSGDLGAGKTTLTQAVARKLGVQENVVSPTFVIMKAYKLSGAKWKHLIHIDAYRLESEKEIEHLGWQELVADPGNLILVEWPERIEKVLPTQLTKLSIGHTEHDGTRFLAY